MDRERGSHNNTSHLFVNTEDPDLTEVQLKLFQGAEAHTQGGDGGQGDGVGVNHGHGHHPRLGLHQRIQWRLEKSTLECEMSLRLSLDT